MHLSLSNFTVGLNFKPQFPCSAMYPALRFGQPRPPWENSSHAFVLNVFGFLIFVCRFYRLKLHSVTPHAKAYFKENLSHMLTLFWNLLCCFVPVYLLFPLGFRLVTWVLNGTGNILVVTKQKKSLKLVHCWQWLGFDSFFHFILMLLAILKNTFIKWPFYLSLAKVKPPAAQTITMN